MRNKPLLKNPRTDIERKNFFFSGKDHERKVRETACPRPRRRLMAPRHQHPNRSNSDIANACAAQRDNAVHQTAGARTRQPENSKRAHLSALVLQTPPKFNEKTPREGRKERILWRERKKKERNFGRSRRRAVPAKGGPGEGRSRRRAVPAKGGPGEGRSRRRAVPAKGGPGEGRSRRRAVPAKGGPGEGRSRRRAVPAKGGPGEGRSRRRAVPGRAVLGRAVPGRAVPGRAVPGRAVPGRAVQGRAVQGKGGPGEGRSRGRAVQGKGGPGEGRSRGRAVRGRAPGRAVPGAPNMTKPKL